VTCEINRLIRGLFPESRFSFQSRCGGPLQSQFPATRVAFTQHRSISRAFSKRGHEVISAIDVVLRIIEFSRDVTKLQCFGESVDRQAPKSIVAKPLPPARPIGDNPCSLGQRTANQYRKRDLWARPTNGAPHDRLICRDLAIREG
jgi:hypothetical protein